MTTDATPRSRTFLIVLLAVACVVWMPLTGQDREENGEQEGAEPATEPIDANVEERVEVALAEVHILVTDKKGNPIPDLEPEEITVLEGGVVQELAYLDSVSGERYAEVDAREAPAPAVLYDGGEQDPLISDVAAVMPAKPVRRVVLVFDVWNSKRKSRDEWKDAALHWVDADMRTEDFVAVVLMRSYPQWLVEFTNDRDLVRRVIEDTDLENSAPDRDRSREVNSLVEDINSLCIDPRGLRGGAAKAGGAPSNEVGCAWDIARGYAAQWDSESKQSIETMRALTGMLASIPGQKVVIMFSEGFITDAAGTAVSAIMGVVRTEDLTINDLTSTMFKESYREFGDLQNTARAGDVSFFTLDTRTSADRGFGGRLEQSSYLNPNSMGVNPWQEMELETRGNLNSLAKVTGGRSYHGTKDLEDKVIAAANSYFGHYLVGYYRSDPSAPARKVQIRIDRKKLDIDYPDEPILWPHKPRDVQLDMNLGAPIPTGLGNIRSVPIALLIPFDSLPLRRGSGGQGLQLGVYLQAIQPDGTVVAEKLEVPAVVANRAQRQTAKGKSYLHQTSIDVSPGSYRIRARISDDRQEIIADRSVDVTVTETGLLAGIRTEEQATQ
jgi:VWFA-related protein